VRTEKEILRAKEIIANRRKSVEDRTTEVEGSESSPEKHLSRHVNLARSYSTKGSEGLMGWHLKLGHAAARNIDRTLQKPMSSKMGFCEGCATGFGEAHPHNAFKEKKEAQVKLPKVVKEEPVKAAPKYRPGEYLYSDMFGPGTQTKGKAHYAMLFICPESSYGTFKMLVHKSDLIEPTNESIVEYNSKSGRAVRVIRADNDGSYISKEWKKTLNDKNVLPAYSSPDDHAQNAAEGRVRVLKRDMRCNHMTSACPNNFWGELGLYCNDTRNNLRSVKRGEVWVTPTMALEGTDTAYDPELMMPFGAKCAVAIRKVDREGRQTLSQVAGWSGIFVGYGFSTGHGGSYRVYDPVRDMIMTVSINLCTVDQTTFPWRVRKEWQNRKLDLPVSIFPTAEALLDQEEIKKYGFNREMLEEVTDQLRTEFTQHREADDKSREEPTMPGRLESEPSTGGHQPQLAAVPAEERTQLAATEQTKDPSGQGSDNGSERKDSSSQGGNEVNQQEEEKQVFKQEKEVSKANHQNIHPQTETSTTGEQEEGVTGVMPHLEGLSPTTAPKKARSEVIHDDSANLVYGKPDLVSARPPRRACSKVYVPAQPRQPKPPQQKATPNDTGRMKPVGSKGKATQYPIDAIRGRTTTKKGVKLVIAHWENYPEKANAEMKESHARKIGLGPLIDHFDQEQADLLEDEAQLEKQLSQKKEEVAKETTLDAQVNALQLLGNSTGGCRERK
jgi:hypothetical protein